MVIALSILHFGCRVAVLLLHVLFPVFVIGWVLRILFEIGYRSTVWA
jgi:hypothetical protein